MDLCSLVSYIQPGAEIRNLPGMDVRVNRHVPPKGGPGVVEALEGLLRVTPEADPWEVHCSYQTLHPFTDGNGRSGRALWLWMMLNQGADPWVMERGFLHTFYYQTLARERM